MMQQVVRRAAIALGIGVVCLFAANCGQTYKLQSITVSPNHSNIEGIGNQQALTVTANFSNGKTLDVTTQAKYELGASTDFNAPLDALTLNNSGMLQAVTSPTFGSGACTWHATPTNAGRTAFAYTTDPYPVTVTYKNNGDTATGIAYVSVDSVGGCYDGVSFVAPSGFEGN